MAFCILNLLLEIPKNSGENRNFEHDNSFSCCRISQGTSMQEEELAEYKSSLAMGPNQALRKGPNDDLLL